MGVHPSDLIKLVTVHEHIHKIQHKVLAEWLGEHTHKEIGKLIEKENEAEDLLKKVMGSCRYGLSKHSWSKSNSPAPSEINVSDIEDLQLNV